MGFLEEVTLQLIQDKLKLCSLLLWALVVLCTQQVLIV